MTVSKSPLYRLQDARKSYGGSFGLRIPRLDIFSGEVFCLLGPTGAGKSTLLRLLSGLESLSSGEISFEDRQLSAENFPLGLQRRITMVHQRPLLLSGAVRSNVEYGLRLRRVPERLSKVEEVLELLGLTDLASRSARALSGGQTQLVALARALVIEPDVLLLDEPTANLDPAHVVLLEQVIAEFQRERGATVVWTTHNLFQAKRVADRVALLLNGQVVETASTQTFFDAPSDSRTLDFVQGKMIY